MICLKHLSEVSQDMFKGYHYTYSRCVNYSYLRPHRYVFILIRLIKSKEGSIKFSFYFKVYIFITLKCNSQAQTRIKKKVQWEANCCQFNQLIELPVNTWFNYFDLFELYRNTMLTSVKIIFILYLQRCNSNLYICLEISWI